MVPLITLWLPILLAAMIVFVASAIMHTVLPYHKSDCQQIPDEALVLAALRTAGLKRGYYHFPFTSHKEMKSPAVIEKYRQGPVGMMTVLPSGPPVMPKFLGMWFPYCLIIGVFVAYLTGHTVAPGASYPAVFSRRRHRCVPGLWSGTAEQWNLEGTTVGHDHQGSHRRACLRHVDRGHLRLALASLKRTIQLPAYIPRPEVRMRRRFSRTR